MLNLFQQLLDKSPLTGIFQMNVIDSCLQVYIVILQLVGYDGCTEDRTVKSNQTQFRIRTEFYLMDLIRENNRNVRSPAFLE